MKGWLKVFDPREWFWHIVGAVVALLLVWYAVHSYNVHVSVKAVAANNLHWVGQFNQQAKSLNELGQQFIDLKTRVITDRKQAAADAAVTLLQEQNRANTAERKYRAELSAKKQLATERDTLVAGNNELRNGLRLAGRPLAAHDGDSAEIGRLRGYADRLGQLHEQCERDLAGVRQVAATAVDRAATAEAGLRALKPVN